MACTFLILSAYPKYIPGGGAGPQHQPRYLLDTAWSSDPVLGLIKTNLYLTNDVTVHVMPPRPDYDPYDGNIVDYLMLAFIEHPRSVGRSVEGRRSRMVQRACSKI